MEHLQVHSRTRMSSEEESPAEGIHISSCMVLTKTIDEENEVALSYHRVRGLYFLNVVFATTISA